MLVRNPDAVLGPLSHQELKGQNIPNVGDRVNQRSRKVSQTRVFMVTLARNQISSEFPSEHFQQETRRTSLIVFFFLAYFACGMDGITMTDQTSLIVWQVQPSTEPQYWTNELM